MCRDADKLQALLVILENVTFACPENEEHLVSQPEAESSQALESWSQDQIADVSGPEACSADERTGGRDSFCAWLTSQLPAISLAASQNQLPRQCLHSALAVLMNVTHNSAAGRLTVASGGGMGTVARLMAAAATAHMAGPYDIMRDSVLFSAGSVSVAP